MRYLYLLVYLLTLPLANWMIGNVGTVCFNEGPCMIPVGFNLLAPSGVIMVGLALVLRDQIQEHLGIKWSYYAIAVGSLVSLLVAPKSLVVASLAAFIVSELLDLKVYSLVRNYGRAYAIILSGCVGSFIDSSLFLLLAFGSLDYVIGQTLAKIYVSILFGVYVFYKTYEGDLT